MSVISSKLLPSTELTENQKYDHEYTHVFLVETNDKQDGPLVVWKEMSTVGPSPVPAINTSYNILTGTWGGDSTSFLKTRTIKRVVEDGTDTVKWLVTCNWGPAEAGSGGEINPNPLLDPPKYRFEWEPFTADVDVDINGVPVVNGAGDAFDPTIQRDDFRPVLVVTRNMYPLQSIVNLIMAYKNTVNSDVFYGAYPGQAKIQSITSGDIQERNGQPFYAIIIRIEFVSRGTGTASGGIDNFLIRGVNRGRHCLDANRNRQVPFAVKLKPGKSIGSTNPDDYERIPEGELGAGPLEWVNLSGTGARLYPDYAPAQFTGTGWQIYTPKPFAALGI